MLNTLIIDDEPLALDVLETYINQMPELNLVARCSNALEANELLRKSQIDLIFLDIQMPQVSGVDFIKTLANPPMFIFTTAFSHYALEGYELNAIDYLLKPISLERFMKAVNKALEQAELRKREEAGESTPGEGIEFFFVKADKKLVKIKYDEILYIEGLKDYVIIRLEQPRAVWTCEVQIGPKLASLTSNTSPAEGGGDRRKRARSCFLSSRRSRRCPRASRRACLAGERPWF